MFHCLYQQRLYQNIHRSKCNEYIERIDKLYSYILFTYTIYSSPVNSYIQLVTKSQSKLADLKMGRNNINYSNFIDPILDFILDFFDGLGPNDLGDNLLLKYTKNFNLPLIQKLAASVENPIPYHQRVSPHFSTNLEKQVDNFMYNYIGDLQKTLINAPKTANDLYIFRSFTVRPPNNIKFFSHNQFTSTTFDPFFDSKAFFNEKDHCCFLIIKVPSGNPLLHIPSSVHAYPEQDEVLLPLNTRLQLVSQQFGTKSSTRYQHEMAQEATEGGYKIGPIKKAFVDGTYYDDETTIYYALYLAN